MRLACLVITLLLSGCGKSFEQRYEDVEAEVEAEARSIDKDIEAQAAKRASAAQAEQQPAKK